MSDPDTNRPSLRLGPGAYAEWRASDIGAITERLERRLLLDLAGDVTGRDVLDVGCGDGEFAIQLWQRDARVVGMDVSRPMIEAARSRAGKRGAEIPFCVAAAENLPFPSERFDIVVASTVLCFVDDAVPVFREMAGVLRPGGRLVIGELGKWSSWAVQRRVRAWFGSSLWRGGRFRTAGDLTALAHEAGLTVETVRGAIYYPRWSLAARLFAPWDSAFGRWTTIGAAFIALSAAKPASDIRI